MIVDRQAEGLGPTGHRLTDPTHADDAKALAGDATAQHPGGGPAGKSAGLDHLRPLHHPAGGGEDQGHGHVGGVLGQHAGRIGDGDTAGVGGGDIDIVDTGPEIRN